LRRGANFDTRTDVPTEPTSSPKASRGARSTSSKRGAATLLRPESAARTERRYAPTPSASAWIAVAVAAFAVVALGAGAYGQWLRPSELGAHPYAAGLLAAGAVLLLGVALLGPRAAKPIRVGDAGVGVEKDKGAVERIAWCDVTAIELSAAALTIKSAALTVTIALDAHAAAAGAALAQARERIAAKVAGIDAKLAVDASAGEALALEPPQVAGQHCKATGKPIAFERDARLCARCGEVYLKSAVPKRCLSCDVELG
jgi:hypothetical protein